MRKLCCRGLMVAAAGIAAAQAAEAQLYLAQPDFRPGLIEGSDPLVGIAIPGATPAEYRATLLWNLRAGLNVAALQCQFSAYLRAVPNYNAILAHHSVELAAGYATLGNYFKRVHGAVRGQKLFDDFSTATYNNFSTLQAQYGFCQTASNIAKSALSTPKGELYPLAQRRLRELRNSLIAVGDRGPAYNPFTIRLAPVPPMRADCWNKKNQLASRCANLTM